LLAADQVAGAGQRGPHRQPGLDGAVARFPGGLPVHGDPERGGLGVGGVPERFPGLRPAGLGDPGVDRVPLAGAFGSGLDGGQSGGRHGGQRLVQGGWLAVAAEPLPQVGPVAVEDPAVPVGLVQAAQEPEQVPLTRRQRAAN
jgi:hypothetical protein